MLIGFGSKIRKMSKFLENKVSNIMITVHGKIIRIIVVNFSIFNKFCPRQILCKMRIHRVFGTCRRKGGTLSNLVFKIRIPIFIEKKNIKKSFLAILILRSFLSIFDLHLSLSKFNVKKFIVLLFEQCVILKISITYIKKTLETKIIVHQIIFLQL